MSANSSFAAEYRAFRWSSSFSLCQEEFLKTQARKINAILKDFFIARNLRLIDFKLEFGKLSDGSIILADEISPDSCRFWDKDSDQKLDKDVFRQDLGNVKVAYEEVLKRILS